MKPGLYRDIIGDELVRVVNVHDNWIEYYWIGREEEGMWGCEIDDFISKTWILEIDYRDFFEAL